jgi:zinc protease
VINGILDIVYTEKVREEKGGTYSVGVSLSAQKRPEQTGEGIITFDCDPARAGELRGIVYNEIENLLTKGPSRENLEKAVKNILKTREESKLHNAYWMSVLTRYYSNGINNDAPENYENILKSFTINDIKKIARKMFRKADVVDIVFKPV